MTHWFQSTIFQAAANDVLSSTKLLSTVKGEPKLLLNTNGATSHNDIALVLNNACQQSNHDPHILSHSKAILKYYKISIFIDL